MNSIFDPEAFLSSSIEAELDTSFTPLPEADYRASIERVDAKQIDSRDKAGEPRQSTILNVVWKILDEEALARIGRATATVRQDIWLDLNSSGGLDTSKGKNIRLGRLRDAVKQNTPGVPWTPQSLIGQVALIHVTLRPDAKDPDTIYNDVSKVTALTV